MLRYGKNLHPTHFLPYLWYSSLCSVLYVHTKKIHELCPAVYIPHSCRHIHPAINTHGPLSVVMSPATVWLVIFPTLKYYE